jgi:hypothetical protein
MASFGGHPQVLARLEFVVIDDGEHGLVGNTQHGDREATPHVVAIVRVGVVDDVTAGLPERLASANYPRRLSLEFEQHLTLEHVAECGTAGVLVRWSASASRWIIDDDGHRVCPLRNRGLYFLHDSQCAFPGLIFFGLSSRGEHSDD